MLLLLLVLFLMIFLIHILILCNQVFLLMLLSYLFLLFLDIVALNDNFVKSGDFLCKIQNLVRFLLVL